MVHSGSPDVSVGLAVTPGSVALALEGCGVDGGDAAAIPGRCRRQVCRARGGRRVFGIVGVSNVAKSTKEFKPAPDAPDRRDDRTHG
jgi:phage terminase large subunit GpA-like protein